jgi:hypothetical protein
LTKKEPRYAAHSFGFFSVDKRSGISNLDLIRDMEVIAKLKEVMALK